MDLWYQDLAKVEDLEDLTVVRPYCNGAVVTPGVTWDKMRMMMMMMMMMTTGNAFSAVPWPCCVRCSPSAESFAAWEHDENLWQARAIWICFSRQWLRSGYGLLPLIHW